MIDLYIPAPSRVQADVFYLAVRNFFAFLLRKSLVAMHLGNAIVQLLHSMNEYREPGVDNMADLLNFLEEEGYMLLAGQSSHALAMLHFGESLRIRHIYTDAFAHCVGMADQLHKSSEYSVSSALPSLFFSYLVAAGISANLTNDTAHQPCSTSSHSKNPERDGHQAIPIQPNASKFPRG